MERRSIIPEPKYICTDSGFPDISSKPITTVKSKLSHRQGVLEFLNLTLCS